MKDRKMNQQLNPELTQELTQEIAIKSNFRLEESLTNLHCFQQFCIYEFDVWCETIFHNSDFESPRVDSPKDVLRTFWFKNQNFQTFVGNLRPTISNIIYHGYVSNIVSEDRKLIDEFESLCARTDDFVGSIDHKGLMWDLFLLDEMREWLVDETRPIPSCFDDKMKHKHLRVKITRTLDEDQKKRDDLRSQCNEFITKIINLSHYN